jgi:pimeloyl-ACP methyl ester carboxylesterase
MDPRFTHQTVTANGRRIHLVEAGEGPMVLMAHGFPESWYSWRHQLSGLADAGYRAVAVDMRGYGRSEKPPRIDDYRITELVADMVGVVAALGAGMAVIVGHDWGAPVAWTAAWTRPDVFTAVAGLSVPFGGRGLMALPTSPFGERRPSEVEREIAGPDKLFYQEYFTIAPGNAEREIERDVRGWMDAAMYSFSASPPLPPEVAAIDFASLPDEHLALVLRETPMCFPPGTEMRAGMALPPEGPLPVWYTQADVDFYVEEIERTGLTGGFNYYRCMDLNWELLAGMEGRPLEVPGLYIGGDRDIVTMWSGSAIKRFGEHCPQARPPVIIAGAGHWIQQEKPAETNAALLEFLGGL